MKEYEGSGGIAPLVLNSAQMDVNGLLRSSVALPPGERTCGTRGVVCICQYV